MESKSVTSKIKLIIVCSSRVDVVINGKIKKKLKRHDHRVLIICRLKEGAGGGGEKSRPLSPPFPPEIHVIPKNPPSPPPLPLLLS